MPIEQQPSTHCLNCGEPLHGKYCAHCGQEDIDYKVALRHLIPEVLHEYLGFDSQIFKSIPLLLFKPGYLTNEFNAGRREKYIPPLRMYLIISLLFFFVQSVTHRGGVEMYSTENGHKVLLDSDSVQAKLDSVYRADSIANKIKGVVPSKDDSWFVSILKEKSPKVRHNFSGYVSELKSKYPEMMFFLLPLCALLLKVLYIRRKFSYLWSRWLYLCRKWLRIGRRRLYARRKALYMRRQQMLSHKRLYIEHLVFSFHIHSFAFVVLGLVYGLNYFFSDFILMTSIVYVVVIIVYLFMAFLRVYKQSIRKTILKFMIFGWCYCFMFVVAYAAMVFITVLMF